MMKWVHGEIDANRIESVSILKHWQYGGIGLLVKWHGPGLISTWISGNSIEECFEKLERIPLPDETWAARMAARRHEQHRVQSAPNMLRKSQPVAAELSFDQYLKSLGVSK